METQGSRFRFVRERLGFSKLEFARSLDIAPSLESVIESGVREASRDVLQRLAVVHKVDLNWFLTGVSDTRIPDFRSSSAASVPLVLQEAAAGRGVDIDDYAETSSIDVPRSLLSGLNPARLRAVTVRGDSMIEKEIFDRDVVIFDPSDSGGECVSVVSLAGQLLVKYVSYDRIKGQLTLISANKVYAPRVIEGDDLTDAKIEGRVVACLHRM